MTLPDSSTPSADHSPLAVWLLGGFRVEWLGQAVVAFESDKARALFCYLLLEGRPIRREQLAGLFWGEQPEARARGNLSRVLSNLRQLLPSCVQSDRTAVSFSPPVPPWIDVTAVSQAYHASQQAPTDETARHTLNHTLPLYRGPLLAGFSLPGCPEFEEWLRIRQEQLHLLALAACDGQTAYYQQRGEWAAAQTCARQSLALEPWRESTHRQLMLLLALQGQREQALRQYEICTHTLERELGILPAAETEALYQRIAAATWTAAEEAVFTLPPPQGKLPPLPLVGRENEHAWLLSRWEAAQRGTGGLTLVAGEAGIGKTRLVQELLRLIRAQGRQVFYGRCYEFTRSLPYQAIHEALQRVGEQSNQPHTPALSHLFQTSLPAPDQRVAFFAAIANWLRSSARHSPPCTFFLDDLHWADADTLDLLHYLIRHLADTPCWFVGAYRPAELPPDHPLIRFTQALNHDGLLQSLPLTPLSPDDVSCLSRRLLPPENEATLAAYLNREGEGNPFFISQLLATLREQGVLQVVGGHWQLVGDVNAPLPLPTPVQEIILQRVQRLDEVDQYLFYLAVAHGRPFEAALLSYAGECPVEVTAVSLARWQERQLIRPVATGWDIAHDKIRSVLYQHVPLPLRRMIHARLGAALEALHPQEVGLLAYHFDRARQEATAAHYWLLAGDTARQSYAQEQAIACYQRGLEISLSAEQRYALLRGLEMVYDMACRRPEQQNTLAQMAQLIAHEPAELCTPPRRIEVALRQAYYAEATSDYVLAAGHAAAAVEIAAATGEQVLLAAGYRQWGYALRRQGDLIAAQQLYEKARVVAGQTAAKGVLSDSLQGLANVAWNLGDYAAAKTYLEQSLPICREVGDQRSEADAYNIYGIVWEREGDWRQAQAYYERSLALRRTIGDRRGQGLSHNNLGKVAYMLGDMAAAAVAYGTAVTLCQEAHDRLGTAIATMGLAAVALAQGELPLAQQYADAGLAGLIQIGDSSRIDQARKLLAQIKSHTR